MANQRVTSAAWALTALLLFAAASAAALAQSEQQKLVNAADATLSNFLRDPQMTWLQENFGQAKAVLIAPEVVKAGFIFGGSGGRAVLIARDPKTGKWAGPAFYTLADCKRRLPGRRLRVGDGRAVTVSDEWNEAYYKKKVQPSDILVSMNVRGKGGDKLLGDAAKATKR